MLIAAGLAVRLAWACGPLTMKDSDEGFYHEMAASTAATGTFSFTRPDGTPQVTAIKSPGLPFFISLLYRVTGPSLRAGRLLVAVLGAALILAVFLLGRELFGEAAGLWAAALVAVHPLLIYWSGVVMTEIPFALLLCLALWLELRAGNRPAALSGVLWGLASLMRSTGLYLSLAQIFWRPKPILLVGLVLIPGAWALRNQQLFGRAALDFNSGWTLATVVMFHDENMQDTSVADAALRRLAWYPEAEKLDEAEKDKFFKDKAMEWVKANPGQVLRQSFDNVAQLWRLYPRQDKDFPRKKLLTLVSLAAELPLFILTAMGLWLERKRWDDWMPLILCFVVLTALHGLTAGQMRYRIPLTPLMAVFAGAALFRLVPGHKA